MNAFSFKDKFYKYCASGNDFIFCALTKDAKFNASALAIRLCDRFKGLGADGFVMIKPHATLDFEWDFYNCDGSKASMCGNASRAAAHFAHHFLKKPSNLRFLTNAGEISASVNKNEVEVCLTPPKMLQENIQEFGRTWQLCDTGVPHLVSFCEDLSAFDLQICKILRDKYNANVNFARIEKSEKSGKNGGEKADKIAVRTFERGVEAETLACGTGMAACFYVANLKGFAPNECELEPKSAECVRFKIAQDRLYFKGEVRFCFEAHFNFA